MIDVQHWLSALPPGVVYLLVAGVIGVESMGVPLPGEIVLVSSALLAATGVVEPEWVASAAAFGAIAGDSVGYAIGRRGGRPLLARLGRRFPKHLGPAQLARAEQSFARHGVWAVFFGRFVALLRILAGPLAGALHVPYRRFLLANAAGGLVWAFGTTYLLYSVGRAAEHWLKDISWAGLVLAVLAGLGSTWWLRRRAHRVESADGGSGVEAAEVASGGQSVGAASGGRSVAAASGGKAAVVAPGVEPSRVGD
ncbi:DedA family protein [Micromonospora vinacea]|uniref:DedA family protein n=1 Tax=Micromonospora vinacea TaxID=709878 RepID=UPI003CF4C1A0|nr:DedA family protein [Micromonospora sp. NBC_00855]